MNNTNNTGEFLNGSSFVDHVETYITFQIATYIGLYWIPIIVPIGLVGNTLSFLVMITPSNRKMSTCIYMAAISINDNIMMLLVLHIWLVTTIEVHKPHPFESKFIAFLIFYAMQNSTLQVLAMTVDKFIAIKWPHKTAIYSTAKGAKITVASVLMFVLCYNIPHIFITKITKAGLCLSYAIGGEATKFYSWLSFILNGLLSFLLLIQKVRSSRKMFGGNGPEEGQDERNGHVQSAAAIRQNKMKNIENQLTIMLLLVTTLFLVLMIPTCIRFVYTSFVTRDTPAKYASPMLFYHISRLLYSTNSGINFFLYCVSGQKFRNDLNEIFCGRKESQRNNTSHSIEATAVNPSILN